MFGCEEASISIAWAIDLKKQNKQEIEWSKHRLIRFTYLETRRVVLKTLDAASISFQVKQLISTLLWFLRRRGEAERRQRGGREEEGDDIFAHTHARFLNVMIITQSIDLCAHTCTAQPAQTTTANTYARQTM
jgi:hypothetical protein